MNVTAFHLMPWPQATSNVAWPYSEDKYDPVIGTDLFETYLDQLAYCETLGYDAVAVNEHHFSAYGLMPDPNVVVSNLAARTESIDLAVMGNVLPIQGNPIRLAEALAMVDSISGGRVISGFVRGVPTEYQAYGIDPDESRSRFAEAWELIVRSWTSQEPFDWDGEYWTYDDVYIWPRPAQQPHPRLWMPAESKESLDFAAGKRVPISQIFVGTESLVDTFEYYRTVATQEEGWKPSERYFWPSRLIYVAETDAKAVEESRPHFEYFYDTLRAGLHRSGIRTNVEDTDYRSEDSFDYAKHAPGGSEAALEFDFDERRASGEIIVGSPATVTEAIEHQYERTGGFGNLVGVFQFGSLPDDLTRRNLELFADEVLPQIRSLGPTTSLSIRP